MKYKQGRSEAIVPQEVPSAASHRQFDKAESTSLPPAERDHPGPLPVLSLGGRSID